MSGMCLRTEPAQNVQQQDTDDEPSIAVAAGAPERRRRKRTLWSHDLDENVLSMHAQTGTNPAAIRAAKSSLEWTSGYDTEAIRSRMRVLTEEVRQKQPRWKITCHRNAKQQ